MSVPRVLAVFRFEFKRTATVMRLAWWAVLAFFPVGIALLLNAVVTTEIDRDGWTTIFFMLIPFIVCLLGMLLWATPILQNELEGGTWTFLAVRPHGKVSVLLGKYLAAVFWTATAGWIGLSLAVLVAGPARAFHTWSVLAVLVLLSSLAYGGLFTFIGVVAHKRAMVLAVGYGLIFEFVVGMIPAMINQFTVQYRLRTLLVLWTDWKNPQAQQAMSGFSGTEPAWKHVLILLAVAAGLVAMATYLVVAKQFSAVDET